MPETTNAKEVLKRFIGTNQSFTSKTITVFPVELNTAIVTGEMYILVEPSDDTKGLVIGRWQAVKDSPQADFGKVITDRVVNSNGSYIYFSQGGWPTVAGGTGATSSGYSFMHINDNIVSSVGDSETFYHNNGIYNFVLPVSISN
ncbi:hypothetical protein HC026_02035 [Lactobacillus sp. LC28-10]|uniref:Uncharacterized protein n=1 Tax=Secundilactobacillus angelensis TaxID=2722706 RepID=A0ABX1KX50_9LACO|nr:hypothetical protein [Secundilactobacillus angelensis]MCH5461493.1 hypothetical protein [Secundilactobacillus angelensis]NLR17694.1 hypothetical protein [Secundilactobacillus angelensis]